MKGILKRYKKGPDISVDMKDDIYLAIAFGSISHLMNA